MSRQAEVLSVVSLALLVVVLYSVWGASVLH